jgi:hypothetical protein
MKKEKIQRKNWRLVRVLEKRAEEEKARAEAEQSDKRKAAIRKAIEVTMQRDAAPFDALEGSPPEWMPKGDIPKWREARRFMLDKYPKKQVQAWIKGAPGTQIPDDDFEEIAESIRILRAMAYLTEKEAKRAQMLTAQRVRAEKISNGYEGRLRLFRVKLQAWMQNVAPDQAARRQKLSGNAIAMKFFSSPELYRDVERKRAPDNLPELSEETIADYVDEIRKRDRSGYKWG